MATQQQPQKGAGQNFDCRDTDDQNDTAIHHEIHNSNDFDQYLINFWHTTNVTSVHKTWEFLSAAMLFQSCDKRKWAFTANENDTNKNEIDFDFEDITGAVTNFSIPLFKGIRNLYPATDFHFYKAKDNTGRFTVIFKVFCSDGTVKFYDLSNDFP